MCMFLRITHLVPAAVGLLFLNVHGQHLAAEGEALGLLNHLLVRGCGVVSHDNMALETRNTTDETRVHLIWFCIDYSVISRL